MSYAFPASASLDTLLDHVCAVIAALEAVPELAALAAPWHKLRDGLLKARQLRDETRWTLLGAQLKVAVRDVAWDAAVGDLSGHAFLAAGKSDEKEPYASLFGPLVAKELRNLGPARATAAAELILAKGAALAHPDLTKSLATLKTATAALAGAAADRDKALEASLLLDIARAKQVTAVDALTATTEIGILTKFPGRRDVVRAVLAQAQPEAKSKAQEADAGTAPAAVG